LLRKEARDQSHQSNSNLWRDWKNSWPDVGTVRRQGQSSKLSVQFG
jgi:hypothetical protein